MKPITHAAIHRALVKTGITARWVMFRQTPRIEDISHCRVWPRWRMTDISEEVNWLCACCLLSAGHCFSAALISGAQLKSKALLTWQSCCLVSYTVSSSWQGHTCFKIAAQTYYAPPVACLHCVQMLLSALQDPTGPSSPPPPSPQWHFRAHLREQAICFGQNSRKQGWGSHILTFLLVHLVSSLSAKWCKKIYTLPIMTWY